MSVLGNWFRNTLGSVSPERVTGRPPSANGASSMHAHWVGLPNRIVSCSVDITVLVRPTSADLHFWALQASFVDNGRHLGAGHFGLQHYPSHPGSSAVNWGGYHSGAGGELSGSPSPLSSTPGNANTRDYPWSEGSTYRYIISRSTQGWQGSIVDLSAETTTMVRELYAPSSHLGGIVMWSEVFAPCQGPTSTVEWSNMQVTADDGETFDINQVSLTFQSLSDGGCTNTSTEIFANGVRQSTATHRAHRHGSLLTIV